MRNDITIRKATVDQIASIAELASRSFRETFAADNNPADVDDYVRTTLSPASFKKQFADERSIFLAAEIQGSSQLVGYAKLRIASRSSSVPGQNPIEIERIYADTALIGRGIGAALMSACLDEAAAHECDVIWLGVWEHNEHAIRFYKRWEFEITGSHEFLLGSDAQNDFIMARELKTKPLPTET